MAMWKDADGLLHDDMDGAALALSSWPANQGLILTKLTKAQADALLHSEISAADTIKQQIRDLEGKQSARRIREAALGIDDGWLANLNAQIEALRAQL